MCMYDPTFEGSGVKQDEYRLPPRYSQHQQHRAHGVVYTISIHLSTTHTTHTVEFLAILHHCAPFWASVTGQFGAGC